MADFIDLCLSSFRCISLLAVLASVIVSSAGYIIYTLYLHPLAKYPGPLLGRLTQAYDVYHAFIGDKHLDFYHLHQQYGPIVRFSPNTLSINDSSALKTIYAHGANVEKSVFYKCFRSAPQAISTLLATEKAHHARKRRIMGQAFSDSALRDLEQYVLGHVQDLVDKIAASGKQMGEKSGWTVPLDMAKFCNWVVFDIMGDLVFGTSFGTLGSKPENREGIHLLNRAAKRNYVVAAMPWLVQTGAEKYLPGFRGLYVDRLKYLAFGKAQVMARQQRDAKGEHDGRKDIFSFLLHAKDPETGEGLPPPEIFMEGNTLIVAGSDTSSTTLSACLYYLLHSHGALAQLEHEVRTTFGHPDEIRWGPPLKSCSWLRACIDETMRMTPAVSGLLPRTVLPGGLEIPALNLDLPAGIDVGVPIYAIHHNSDYIINPFEFDPGRWLQEGHRQDKEALQAVFTPFSLGHRSCLGKPLVYMELAIAVARLVWEYDMKLALEQPVSEVVEREIETGKRRKGEYQVRDWFLSRNESVMVEFRKSER